MSPLVLTVAVVNQDCHYWDTTKTSALNIVQENFQQQTLHSQQQSASESQGKSICYWNEERQ